uniref:Uncharacterized protein n=1 Tax=Aegilops tauschii subsp. strangulata TaxID=200361 RepID=A0A453QNE7_AEGTS
QRPAPPPPVRHLRVLLRLQPWFLQPAPTRGIRVPGGAALAVVPRRRATRPCEVRETLAARCSYLLIGAGACDSSTTHRPCLGRDFIYFLLVNFILCVLVIVHCNSASSEHLGKLGAYPVRNCIIVFPVRAWPAQK